MRHGYYQNPSPNAFHEKILNNFIFIIKYSLNTLYTKYLQGIEKIDKYSQFNGFISINCYKVYFFNQFKTNKMSFYGYYYIKQRDIAVYSSEF